MSIARVTNVTVQRHEMVEIDTVARHRIAPLDREETMAYLAIYPVTVGMVLVVALTGAGLA